jgi:predicted HTH domain antitoxin
MTISFELPRNIEQELRTNGADLNREAKEAYVVELYRQHKISQHQLAEALGLSRVEADGVLKKHEVWLELTPEELAAQAASLRETRPA